MKLIIKREYLLYYLKKIYNISRNKSSLSILENILIKVNKNLLYLTVTNLEIEITTKIKLKKQYKNFITTLSINKFLNICNSLPINSIIKIIFKNQKAFLYSKNIRFVLSTLPYKNFPIFNKSLNIFKIKVSQIKLKNLIKNSKNFISNENTKNNLNYLLLDFKKKKINIVATDGFRLIISKIKIHNKLPKYSIIISKKNIIELINFLENKDIYVEIILNKDNLKIKIKNLIFTLILIKGKYPNYKSIINKKRKNKIEINSNLLYESCNRVSILSNEINKGIFFSVKKNILKIKSLNSKDEKAVEYLTLNKKYKNYEFSFNSNYILNILKNFKNDNFKNDNIEIKLSNNILDGFKINSKFNKLINYIIMPINL